MIVRRQFRGCRKMDIPSETEFENAVETARMLAAGLVEKGSLLLAALFCYESMCYLYFEALEEEGYPGDFLKPLEPFMELWPEAEGKTAWAPMCCVYYHSVPGKVEDWERGRSGKTRVGRIAFLYPEKLTSYVYWHKAIVDEGLFTGDKYQYISLHETVLFSYFEEPKEMVSIRGAEAGAESEAIKGWMKQRPETHFDREKTGGSNFMVIPTLFSVGRSDL